MGTNYNYEYVDNSRSLRQICNSYLDETQSKVRAQLRILHLIEEFKTEAITALMDHDRVREYARTIMTNKRKIKNYTELEIRESMLALEAGKFTEMHPLRDNIDALFKEVDKEKGKEFVEKMKEANPGYKSLHLTMKAHIEVQNRLKEEAYDLIPDELKEYVSRVKGFGEVAVVTLGGYINPHKCESVGKLWKYTGFAPGTKFKKGVRGTSNKEVQGRFWVLGRNMKLAKDPLYYNLYVVKKEYFMARPDLVAASYGWGESKPEWLTEGHKHPSWKAWMDSKATAFIIKVMMGHAVEIIRTAAGYTFDQSVWGVTKMGHRHYIPVRPKENAECMRVADLYKQISDVLLEEKKNQYSLIHMGRDKTEPWLNKTTWLPDIEWMEANVKHMPRKKKQRNFGEGIIISPDEIDEVSKQTGISKEELGTVVDDDRDTDEEW